MREIIHFLSKGLTGFADLQAYDYFLLGRASFFRVTKEDNVKARELFHKATQLDPNYSLAHTWLAWTHLLDFTWGWSDTPVSSGDLAFDHAQKAVALDNTAADGHWVLGSVLINIRGQPEAGLAEYEQALALNPNNADLIAEYGWALPRLGRAEEGIEFIEKAMRLNPVYPDWYRQALMFAFYIAKRYQEVIAVADTLKIRLVDTYLVLAGSHAQLGQLDNARQLAAKVMEMKPDFSLRSWREIQVFTHLADLEHYFDGLQKAGLPEDPPLVLPDKPSIAVLPFTNMSNDAEQEYFVDGMTDDLITDLSKLSGLFVIARNSSFTYKGKTVDVRDVARDLGVRYILEGSARRVGDKIRVNVQLIDATTGGHLWAERYDRNFRNIFSLQDELIGHIVTALALELTPIEEEHLAHHETNSIEAYDVFLQGWAHYEQRTPDGFRQAVSYFKQAIELDPDYGRAHGALAATYWLGTRNRSLAEKHLQKAMENPTPVAHRVASLINSYRGRHEEAIVEAERAIALDPNDPVGYFAMNRALTFAGKPAEAIDYIERAMRLNPHYPPIYLYRLGFAQFGLERYSDTAATLERSILRDPEFTNSLELLVATYGHLNRLSDAKAIREQLGYWPNCGWWRFKEKADRDRLCEGLRKARSPE